MVARHDLAGRLLVMGNTCTTQQVVFLYSPIGDKLFWPWLDHYNGSPWAMSTSGIESFSIDPETGKLYFAFNHDEDAIVALWAMKPSTEFP